MFLLLKILKAREWFNDARFGLFIHWGPFSIPGQGEWVMNNLNITVKNYTRPQRFFQSNRISMHKNGWQWLRCRNEIHHAYHKTS
jgi:alpha-L-fucosidase